MKYRKKPVVIEAVQVIPEHIGRCVDFCDTFVPRFEMISNGNNPLRPGSRFYAGGTIHTPEGAFEVKAGAWIIRGIKGEFYCCDPGVFAETYEPVE